MHEKSPFDTQNILNHLWAESIHLVFIMQKGKECNMRIIFDLWAQIMKPCILLHEKSPLAHRYIKSPLGRINILSVYYAKGKRMQHENHI
jgi:hypothetical protein